MAAADGRREVLGFDVGDTENESFWAEFLRSLKVRGLDGVQLVMSDAHSGLKKAIGTVFQGASWQRCRVHFMRNVLSVVPKGSQDIVASIIRTVFAQPDREHIVKQFGEVATMLARSHPKVAAMLADAEHDLLTFAAFPQRHWLQVWSTNPLERVNKQIKRRTDVVGIFPNPAALLRLAGAVLVEQHDEWEADDRRYFSEVSMLELRTITKPIPHGKAKAHHSKGRHRSPHLRTLRTDPKWPQLARDPVRFLYGGTSVQTTYGCRQFIGHPRGATHPPKTDPRRFTRPLQPRLGSDRRGPE